MYISIKHEAQMIFVYDLYLFFIIVILIMFVLQLIQ